MKKLVILLTLVASVANAATTGTLVLTGVVNALFDLTVTPTSAASNINITGGETNLLVANVSETSNNPSGYKITLSSANGGMLKNSTLDQTSYQISYNGSTMATPTTSPMTVKTVSSMSGGATATSTVRVNVTAKSSALAGTYTDTLTFTISAP